SRGLRASTPTPAPWSSGRGRAVPEPRTGLRDVPPYRAPQIDVPVRLNTNECPYSLPDGFIEDAAGALRRISFNRYPDRDAASLRDGIGRYVGEPAERVWPANGSNEIIQQLLLAYGGPGRRCLLFVPTYVLHEHLAWMTHTEIVRIDAPDPFEIRDEQIGAATGAGAEVVFVCSPNNPTGNAQHSEVVEELATGTDALVVVDEAYVEFGGPTATALVRTHPNVAVVRTFSKAF